jgi:hypothetical protein
VHLFGGDRGVHFADLVAKVAKERHVGFRVLEVVFNVFDGGLVNGPGRAR